MMKAAMRMQKTQLASYLKITASGTFHRDRYLMAGYKNFDLMVVGASGGRSGYHTYSSTHKAYSSGGGGGGSIRAQGALLDLPSVVDYVVGAAGTDGAPNTGGPPSSVAQAGVDGGDSAFDIFYGYGGGGGTPGGFFTVGIPPQTGYRGCGGGDGGVGGLDLYQEARPAGGFHTSISSGAAEAGTWHAYNDDVDLGSGGGGGGGLWDDNSVSYAAQAGAYGSVSSLNPYAASGGAVESPSKGGFGGGVNIRQFTGGVDEVYGSRRAGANGSGVILLRFS